jgi:hypothetical protein
MIFKRQKIYGLRLSFYLYFDFFVDKNDKNDMQKFGLAHNVIKLTSRHSKLERFCPSSLVTWLAKDLDLGSGMCSTRVGLNLAIILDFAFMFFFLRH